MEKRTDKNVYTILFAIAMVFVVGSLLAYTASSLKPAITENERIEKQQNILYAMGFNENEENTIAFVSTDTVAGLFASIVKEQLVLEVQDGKLIKEQTREEYMAANNGQEPYLIDVKKQQAQAKQGNPRKLPLFVSEHDGETLYVAPIYGKGLWDAIWGFIAVDKDMIVRGTFFDHAGETPGLGANIKQRYFMDDFYGEHLLTSQGVFKGIAVAKGNNDPKNERKEDYKVDALAGATITGDGVSAMIKADLGLYVPFFQNLNK
ncbi:Na(+)-translocating NADH-quinone reductase subunit C [Subsaximicrobium wynnwilliamsii]|jgi:Na+-transporting NADH:ubiquinone oxidoreductase subunit C|uniref:Na(+)-translocating NADH-quinone reductase subunit C n=1 Tax=Subsaximicrobium wynnwilliamsii TaxID=291179 RepID=A0A5C6ZCX8_9FLAO|nr:Na(+)-translocating NADH-quinone reductase subunit C [Subsaximicrobium wynnwilliamsii]TXD81828.1 Na(+)-translocating NADH-quinone reductase subunit C [Subsaximicrobium wynnwilliamsii]TXD87497.1 Na(+)-translocating NADH-quinone reductase subunit C [Subsaximicrobium wynnwilliamsii]TXE01180.1 Na(+)-translocating NADH-quinone reductase subunit C [Subsaximicrobium wynnwilliamsii]